MIFRWAFYYRAADAPSHADCIFLSLRGHRCALTRAVARCQLFRAFSLECTRYKREMPYCWRMYFLLAVADISIFTLKIRIQNAITYLSLLKCHFMLKGVASMVRYARRFYIDIVVAHDFRPLYLRARDDKYDVRRVVNESLAAAAIYFSMMRWPPRSGRFSRRRL